MICKTRANSFQSPFATKEMVWSGSKFRNRSCSSRRGSVPTIPRKPLSRSPRSGKLGPECNHKPSSKAVLPALFSPHIRFTRANGCTLMSLKQRKLSIPNEVYTLGTCQWVVGNETYFLVARPLSAARDIPMLTTPTAAMAIIPLSSAWPSQPT